MGSLAFARGFFITKKEALDLGVLKWAGSTEEENLRLPQVRERLNQRKWGAVGAIFMTAGFVLQLISII